MLFCVILIYLFDLYSISVVLRYILKYDINKLCCSVISYPESRIFYNFRIKKYILTKKCYSPHQKINVNTLTITIFKEKKIISFPTYGTYITEPHIDLALRARSILYSTFFVQSIYYIKKIKSNIHIILHSILATCSPLPGAWFDNYIVACITNLKYFAKIRSF